MGCLYWLFIVMFVVGALTGNYLAAAVLLFLISAMWVMRALGGRNG